MARASTRSTKRPATVPDARADEVRQVRRKQPGSSALAGIKLSVDETRLDRETYHYRFAADKGGRVQSLINQDYDIAPEMAKTDSSSLGSLNTAHGGVDEDRPYDMVLLRKRTDWFEADQKEKQRPLDATEEAIRRGKDHSANSLRGEGVYTPDAGNRIE